jgi:hypothetical protein
MILGFVATADLFTNERTRKMDLNIQEIIPINELFNSWFDYVNNW